MSWLSPEKYLVQVLLHRLFGARMRGKYSSGRHQMSSQQNRRRSRRRNNLYQFQGAGPGRNQDPGPNPGHPQVLNLDPGCTNANGIEIHSEGAGDSVKGLGGSGGSLAEFLARRIHFCFWEQESLRWLKGPESLTESVCSCP